MAIAQAPYRFTSAEYHRMAELGILSPDARIELIDGVIIEMSPIGRRHLACVDRLSKLFNSQLGDAVIVRTQSSVVLGDGREPEPDIALLRFRADFYAEVAETPADVLLIVEVADSSLEYDRRTKAPLYARHGVPELWIADLNRECLLMFRDPTPLGYASTQVLRTEEQLSPLAFSDLAIRVGTIFGR
jgi:Uma2 family endonuclease